MASAFHQHSACLAGAEIGALSIAAINRVFELDLQASEKWLLTCLASKLSNTDYRAAVKPVVSASMNELAQLSGLSKRGTLKVIERLISGGNIHLEKCGAGRGKSNTYHLAALQKGEQSASQKLKKPVKKGEHSSQKGEQSAPFKAVKGEQSAPQNDHTYIKDITSIKGGRKSATPAPENISITGKLKQWSAENTSSLNLKTETDRFLDYHRAKGTQFKDWAAAWRNWMRKAVEFQQEKPQRQDADLGDDPYTEARSTTP